VTTRGLDPRRRSRGAAPGGEPASERTAATTSDWAENNRIVCDFFHRGIVRELLPRQRVREWEITEWRPGSRAARASGLSPRSLEAVSSARLVNEVRRPSAPEGGSRHRRFRLKADTSPAPQSDLLVDLRPPPTVVARAELILHPWRTVSVLEAAIVDDFSVRIAGQNTRQRSKRRRVGWRNDEQHLWHCHLAATNFRESVPRPDPSEGYTH
jgi:hypothetical protein